MGDMVLQKIQGVGTQSGGYWQVGSLDYSGYKIAKIVSVERPGQMAMISWYQLLADDESVIIEINSEYVEFVRYFKDVDEEKKRTIGIL